MPRHRLAVPALALGGHMMNSTPEWSWWVSHAVFGMTLGLVGSVLLRRRAGRQDEPRFTRS